MTGERTRAEVAVLAAIGYVAVLATASLLLAAAGWHAAAPAVAVVALAVVAFVTVRALRGAAPDRAGALVLAGAVVVGGLLYVPAFPYGSSDRDPGVYAQATYAIARTGSLYVPDPLAGLPPDSALEPILDGQRVPGLHPKGDTALPGFFLAEPALGATVFRVAGDAGRRLVNPFVAILAVAAFGLTVRRLVSPLAGALTVLLLAGTMVQVWQAKTPGPEMLAQAGVAGAMLAAAARNGPAAGALTVFAWVARPDGLLAALLGFAAGHRSRGYLTGFAAAAPVAAWQTYVLADDYAARNGVAPWPVLAAVAVLVVAAGELARRRGVLLRLDRVAPAIPVAAVAFVAFLLLRQAFAADPPPLRPGTAPLGYEPYALARIAGLVTWPAVALALAGVADVARHRRWLLLAPAVLGAPYLYDPRISPDLMFWGRRFVPTLLPAVAVLAAVGGAALLARRRLAPLGAVALAVALAVPYAQSVPLRGHREYGGGLAAARAAADASGDEQAVYIWVRAHDNCCDQAAYLFAGTVWLRYGKASMTVSPEEVGAQAAAAAALPQGWPVLVVAPGTAPPLPGVERVAYHARTIPVWERGGLDRPARARQVFVDFTVWRYATTP